jgi:hypothetical protein
MRERHKASNFQRKGSSDAQRRRLRRMPRCADTAPATVQIHIERRNRYYNCEPKHSGSGKEDRAFFYLFLCKYFSAEGAGVRGDIHMTAFGAGYDLNLSIVMCRKFCIRLNGYLTPAFGTGRGNTPFGDGGKLR